MRVLGIETSGEVTGAAVADAEGVVAEVRFRHRMQLSRWLAPRIQNTLELAGLTPDELDGLAVSIGPGSFTGLRIGVTMGKTLAFALAAPVVGVGTLEALAWEHPAPERALVCALISASATEVYAALYQWRGGQLEPRAQEMLIPTRDLARRLAQSPLEVVFVGQPGPHREVLAATLGARATLPPEEQCPRPGTIALLGRRKLEAGERVPVHALVPRYLRVSAAEARRQARPPASVAGGTP